MAKLLHENGQLKQSVIKQNVIKLIGLKPQNSKYLSKQNNFEMPNCAEDNQHIT